MLSSLRDMLDTVLAKARQFKGGRENAQHPTLFIHLPHAPSAPHTPTSKPPPATRNLNLHAEKRTDKTGKQVTRWVAAPQPQTPTAPEPERKPTRHDRKYGYTKDTPLLFTPVAGPPSAGEGPAQPTPPITPKARPQELTDYLSRLLHPARRAYAEALAAQHEGGPEAQPDGLDDDTAEKIKAKVNRYLSIPGERASKPASTTTTDAPKPGREPRPTAPPASPAAKLRQLAGGMQNQIDKLAQVPFQGMNVTHRRAGFQASRARDHERATELQRFMRALADMHDDGTVPAALAGINSRAAAENVLNYARAEMEYQANYHRPYPRPAKDGYPYPYVGDKELAELAQHYAQRDPAAARELRRMDSRRNPDWNHVQLNAADATLLRRLILQANKEGYKPGQYTWQKFRETVGPWQALQNAGITRPSQYAEAVEAAKELRLQATQPTAQERQARAVKELERKLIGANIPGYFPTPRTLGEQIVHEAQIGPGMSVLEPSAGKGNLADLIREQHPDANLSVIEYNSSLNDLLKLKGHAVVGSDFTAHHGQYDRIIMNPPFENRQDAQHVMHAYEQLKPGGRLVAIMSEGPFFGSDVKAQAFRTWLEQVGGSSEKNPEGSFKISDAGRSTGVNTRTVIIDKPEAPAPSAGAATTDTAPPSSIVSTPRQPGTYHIRAEQEPFSRTGTAYRAYAPDGTPHYLGAETREGVEERIRQTDPQATIHHIGDTKTEGGATYRLNDNHRWERVDEPAQAATSAEPPADSAPKDETATPEEARNPQVATPAPQPTATVESAPAAESGGFDAFFRPSSQQGKPSSPPAPRPTAQDGDYVDVGEKIGMARKDLAALMRRFKTGEQRVTPQDLPDLEGDPALASEIVSRDRQAGTRKQFTEELRQAGVSPGAAYVAQHLLSLVQPKPEDSPAARQAYVIMLDRLTTWARQWRNGKEAMRGVYDIRDALNGVDLTPEEFQQTLNLDRSITAQKEVLAAAWKQFVMSSPNPPGPDARQAWIKGEGAPLYAPIMAVEDEKRAIREAAKKRAEGDKYASGKLAPALGEKFTDWMAASGSWREREKFRDRLKSMGEKALTFDMKEDWSWHDKGRTPPAPVSREKVEKPKWQRDVPDEVERIGGVPGTFVAQTLLDRFKLRGVEYGNWMDEESSREHTQRAGEALADMAELFGLTPEQISLNGRLAMAFGARGKGRALAHYEPERKVINMTKFKGGGSLAHEWGHFLDNVMALVSTDGESHHNSYVTERGYEFPGASIPQAVRDAMQEVGRAINEGHVMPVQVAVSKPALPKGRGLHHSSTIRKFLQEDSTPDQVAERLRGIYETRLMNYTPNFRAEAAERLNKLMQTDMHTLASVAGQHIQYTPLGAQGMSAFKAAGKAMGESYEGKPVELFARAFESFVEDELRGRGWRNTYLVAGTGEAGSRFVGQMFGLKEGGPYPIGEERQRINAALRKLMTALRESGTLAKAARLLGGQPGFIRHSLLHLLRGQ